MRKEILELLRSKAATRIEKMTGDGLEAIKKPGPKILATTHLTDLDATYAGLALLPQLGIDSLRFAHSSSHRTLVRPEINLLYNIATKFLSEDPFRPVSHTFTKIKVEGKKVVSEHGRLAPSDWLPLIEDLVKEKSVLTAAYFDDRSYFKLPETIGLLPLILKHKVPGATLIPIATVFPEEAYKKKQRVPLSKAEIKVGAPVELSPLSWSMEENNPIQTVFTDFTGKPIDFFEKYLNLPLEERRKLTKEQKDILKKEFDHIKDQLRAQSRTFLEKLKELLPDYLRE